MMTHLHRAWSAASRGRTLASFATVLVALAAHVAGGQSNLSSQGFGYPPGQFSSRALGTGAATCWLRLASAAGPVFVGYLVAARGTAAVFVMFAGAGLIGAVAALGMLETRNRRLEELAP